MTRRLPQPVGRALAPPNGPRPKGQVGHSGSLGTRPLAGLGTPGHIAEMLLREEAERALAEGIRKAVEKWVPRMMNDRRVG